MTPRLPAAWAAELRWLARVPTVPLLLAYARHAALDTAPAPWGAQARRVLAARMRVLTRRRREARG